jgi:hypothetical protein
LCYQQFRRNCVTSIDFSDGTPCAINQFETTRLARRIGVVGRSPELTSYGKDTYNPDAPFRGAPSKEGFD